jgi:hypothetical protein
MGRWTQTKALAAGIALTVAVVIGVLAIASGSGSNKPAPHAGINGPGVPPQVTGHSPPTRRVPAAKLAPHRKAAPRRHHSTARNTTPAAAHASTRATATTSSHSTTTPGADRQESVSLVLHGGGNATSGACGAVRHYKTYAPGSNVLFTGQVSPIPSAVWKVKLKIKFCSGGQFQDLTKIDTTENKHHGTFTVSFPAPHTGLYEARAELYVNDAKVTESSDLHFAT